jgi:hypothetical protein
MPTETKFFEVRDECTHISAFGILINPDHSDAEYPLRRAGYGVGNPCVLFGPLDSGKCHSDPYDWGSHTLRAAHLMIERDWDTLISGQVVDVRVFLGERAEPVESDRTATLSIRERGEPPDA